MSPPPNESANPASADAESARLQHGDIVGDYRVEKYLRTDSFADFYLVRHLKGERLFSLKLLQAKLARDGAFVARFKREAELLARIQHEHVVNVTDFGLHVVQPYLVIEYLEGGSLEDWMLHHTGHESRPSQAEVRQKVDQVLQGLAGLHREGIVHRDLKPANLLLTSDGRVKISSLYLARLVDPKVRAGAGSASVTTGAMVGTIDYMSPEARKSRPTDVRSDIYAVGVLTYYFLTGLNPHGLARYASQVVPGLDKRWDSFIETCMAEDPAKRYQTAEAALEALRRVEMARSRTRYWLAAAGVLVALGIGIWFGMR